MRKGFDNDNVIRYERVVDIHGQPLSEPVNLSAGGGRLPAEAATLWIYFVMYPPADWAPLGLP